MYYYDARQYAMTPEYKKLIEDSLNWRNKMSIKMLHNQVLVTSTEEDKTSAGGIILTADTTKGSKPALVLAVNDQIESEWVKAGDRVFLDWTKTMPVDVDGKAAAIIDAEHIKAVLG